MAEASADVVPNADVSTAVDTQALGIDLLNRMDVTVSVQK